LGVPASKIPPTEFGPRVSVISFHKLRPDNLGNRRGVCPGARSLAHVFDHPNTLFQNLLRLKSQMARIGRDVKLIRKKRVHVIEIIENRNRRRCVSETLAVPADLPQDAVQIRLALEKINFVSRAAGVPNNPAAKDLARRIFEVIHPQAGICVVLLARRDQIRNRMAVRRPA
jgi:hypothetical protein